MQIDTAQVSISEWMLPGAYGLNLSNRPLIQEEKRIEP